MRTACKEERSGWKGTEENVMKPTPQDVDSFFYSAIFDIIYIYIYIYQCCMGSDALVCLGTWYTCPPFTWHFESGLSHSHAQANPDSIGIRSRLNPDYRILVRRWIICGFRCEIAQSRSQVPERARKVGGKGDAYGASFPNSLKSCAGAAIIATYPDRE